MRYNFRRSAMESETVNDTGDRKKEKKKKTLLEKVNKPFIYNLLKDFIRKRKEINKVIVVNHRTLPILI